MCPSYVFSVFIFLDLLSLCISGISKVVQQHLTEAYLWHCKDLPSPFPILSCVVWVRFEFLLSLCFFAGGFSLSLLCLVGVECAVLLAELLVVPCWPGQCRAHSGAVCVALLCLGRHWCFALCWLLLCSLRTEKELHRRQDMPVNLRSKANQMASTLSMSNFANRL